MSRESKICLRLVSRNANDKFDAAFWKRRIKYAWDYRKTVMAGDESCCRVIFGEADGFPGLTVDRFSGAFGGADPFRGHGAAQAPDLPSPCGNAPGDGQDIRGIFERNDVPIRALEGLEQGKGWFRLPGEAPPESPVTEICENGIYYKVDVENGQKTGFFLDQKYNRRAVPAGEGPRVLDCFTHTGSFALNAALGGAAHVTAVDVSAPAIETARANAERNGLSGKMDFLVEDIFTLLPALEKRGGAPMISSFSTRPPSQSPAKPWTAPSGVTRR